MFIQIENTIINKNHIISVIENDFSEYEPDRGYVEVPTLHAVKYIEVNPKGLCITVNLTNGNAIPFAMSLDEFNKYV